MNIRKIYKLFAVCLLTSCSYLDVVPPEQPDLDDMLRDEASTVRMLYSCYSYAQNSRLMPMALAVDMGGQTILYLLRNGNTEVLYANGML